MFTSRTLRSFGTLAGLGLALSSGVAWAHPGHEHLASGGSFAAGFIHPLTGFDHLFAMLAVGLRAALTHDNVQQALRTPASFLCLLLAGALLGIAGITPPAIEAMIMASLFVLGLLVATRLSLPGWAGAALVGFFALFHGIAHGSELPLGSSAVAFVGGFMLSTLALHLVGLTTGFALKQRGAVLARVTGIGIAAYGVALLATAG